MTPDEFTNRLSRYAAIAADALILLMALLLSAAFALLVYLR